MHRVKSNSRRFGGEKLRNPNFSWKRSFDEETDRFGSREGDFSSMHTPIPTRPRLTRILDLARHISTFSTGLMTVLSFADSGRGFSNLTLETVANKAIELGFEKEGALNKKPAQRADLQRFFNTYGVKAFSRFKDKFEKEKLLPPEEYLAQKEAAERAAKESEFAPVTEEEYNEATHTADAMEKKWRLFKKCVARIPSVLPLNVAEPFADINHTILIILCHYNTRPGGIGVKSDLYYDVHGARSQVDSGDITTECPQWNDIGAVDYVGKATWLGHHKLKGKSKAQAQAIFCKLLNDALADKKAHFYP